MRRALVSFGLSAAMAVPPVAALAAPTLRVIMHAWQNDARAIHEMLTGRTAFDEGTIRRAFQTYATDAGGISSAVTGGSPKAREFKQRFLAFRSGAQSALNDLGNRATLAAAFSQLMSQCQSCHNRFKN